MTEDTNWHIPISQKAFPFKRRKKGLLRDTGTEEYNGAIVLETPPLWITEFPGLSIAEIAGCISRG